MNRKNDPMQQLTNATELLEMLEHIFDSRSSDKIAVSGEVFPWSGVKLTLGLAREQLQCARTELAADMLAAAGNRTSVHIPQIPNTPAAAVPVQSSSTPQNSSAQTPTADLAGQNVPRRVENSNLRPEQRPDQRQDHRLAGEQSRSPINQQGIHSPISQDRTAAAQPERRGQPRAADPRQREISPPPVSNPVGSTLASRIHRAPIANSDGRNGQSESRNDSSRPVSQPEGGRSPVRGNPAGPEADRRIKLGRIREIEDSPAAEGGEESRSRRDSADAPRKSLVANQKSV